MGRDRSSHWLNTMVGEVAATVACDLGSNFSLPKPREFKRIRSANLVDRQHRIRDAALNSEGLSAEGVKQLSTQKSIGSAGHHV